MIVVGLSSGGFVTIDALGKMQQHCGPPTTSTADIGVNLSTPTQVAAAGDKTLCFSSLCGWVGRKELVLERVRASAVSFDSLRGENDTRMYSPASRHIQRRVRIAGGWKEHLGGQMGTAIVLDISGSGDLAAIACSWSGVTHIRSGAERWARFRFGEPVQAFAAGRVAEVPWLAYVTFSGEVIVYTDLGEHLGLGRSDALNALKGRQMLSTVISVLDRRCKASERRRFRNDCIGAAGALSGSGQSTSCANVAGKAGAQSAICAECQKVEHYN